MIQGSINGTTFILRVAAICIEDDRILVCRPPELDFWYAPGGRVHIGESLRAALDRELLEELDTRPQEAELLWITENFLAQTQPFHEVGIYFKVKLPPGAAALGWHEETTQIETGDENELLWNWVPLDGLQRIDLRPPFLAERIRRSLDGIAHIVHRRD